MYLQRNSMFLLISSFIFILKITNADVLTNNSNLKLLSQISNGTFGHHCGGHEDCLTSEELYCINKTCQCLPLVDKWNFDLLRCVDVDYCKNNSECRILNNDVDEHKICDLAKEKCTCDVGYKYQLSSNTYPKKCIMKGDCQTNLDCLDEILMTTCQNGKCNCSNLNEYDYKTNTCHYEQETRDSSSFWPYYVAAIVVIIVFIGVSIYQKIFKK